MLDLKKTRDDFHILNGKNEKSVVYFDNACMSLKPNSVVEAMNEYYFEYPACGFRSSHKLADRVTKKVKETRVKVAKFINAKEDIEIIFVRNTTEGINLLASGLKLEKDDVVLISDKEHNSNLIPWLLLQDRVGIVVKIIPSNEDGTFNLESLRGLIEKSKLVSIVHTSNLDGTTNPVKEIIEIAHKNDALVFLDCAQSMMHERMDVQDLDADFIAFSGHKMLGPTGVGVLYGKYYLLEKLSPFITGGDTVSDSTYDSYEFLEAPEKFEAGLQDYAGIIGFGKAIDYLGGLDFNQIKKHLFNLNSYITEELVKFPQIKIIGPKDPSKRSGIVNFYIENKDMHQIAVMLDELDGIAVRSGRHCVHSWFNNKKILNSLRVSFSFYNTREEAEKFINSLIKILKVLS